METSKEKVRFILQFIFDKVENAYQASENVQSVFPDTVTSKYAQFIWFRQFLFDDFDGDEPHSGKPIVENINKIIEIAESNRHVRTASIVQELNNAQKPWKQLKYKR